MTLARELNGLAPASDVAPFRERYEALINDPDAAPFLALADGDSAGMAILRFRRRLNFATFEGWLSELYVEPATRGRGIGAALLQAVLAEWRLRGSHRVLASVAEGEAAGRTLLERSGFEEGFLDFRLAPVVVPDRTAPDGVGIRPLSDGDADAVTRLIAEFGPRRSPVPERMDAVLRTYGAHARDVAAGRAASLVAELEGVVVGACILEWQRPFWSDELRAWIPDLVVTEPVRGRGIGRALLAAALRAAARAGADELRLESGPQRESAHRLYRSTGFTQVGHTLIFRRGD